MSLLAAACGGSDDADDGASAESVVEVATAEPEPTAEPQPDPTEEPEPTAEPEPEPTEAPEPAPTDEPEPELAEEEVAELPLAAESIEWTDCGDAQCGTVEVPLDYSGEHEGTLDIAVKIRRSTNLDERVGYLFINPGGPGLPSQDIIDGTYPEELEEAFDLVGFDPRGVGESEPRFGCGVGTEQFDLLQEIDELPDTDAEVAIGNQAAALCIDTMGPAGALVHSEYVARDMDEIRKALGVDQISYLGFSYGSTLGGWYASIFPDSVRSMALDGAGNPLAARDTPEAREKALRDLIGPLHDAFERALDACDSDRCPIYNDGDPKGYFTQAAAKMNLLAEASSGDWSIVIPAINGGLYTETTWPQLHQAIADLQENDDPAGMVQLGKQSGLTGGLASAVQHINCLDEQVLFPDEDLAYGLQLFEEEEEQVEAILTADYPLFAVALENAPLQLPACVFYDSISPPAFDGTFDGGGIPILVVGNDKDQVTPLVQSEQYANDVLGDGRLISTSHYQHVVYPGNSCINDLVHAALIDLDYPDDEPTCPEQTLDDVSSGVDPDAAVDLVPLELPGGITTLRPADWTEVDEGVFLRTDANPLGTLLVAVPHGGDRDGILDSIAENLPGTELESGPSQEFNGTTWDTFEAELDGANLAVRVGVSDGPDGMFFLLQSTKDDLDGLTEAVLIPALQAYTTGE